MAKLPINPRLGKKLEGDAGKLQNIVSDIYSNISFNMNRRPEMVIKNGQDPVVGDIDFNIGTFWFNRNIGGTAKVYILREVNKSTRQASWLQIF